MTIKQRIALLCAALLLPSTAAAQYKCTINGKTVYADAPCARDAKPVGALQDSVSQEQEIQRLRQSLSEKKQRDALEGRQSSEIQARERKVESFTTNEQAQARAASAAKQRRCASLEYDMQRNQRNIALGQDVGWQRTITQHENELKQRREAYDRDCR